MPGTSWKGVVALLLAALLWGMAFVAQSDAANYLEPFTYNAVRSAIGSLTLIPVFCVLDAGKRRAGTYQAPRPGERRRLWIGGAVCGAALFVATNLQQMGIDRGTDPGKAGFITALYILLVPILGLFLKRPIRWWLWPCVGVGLVGLYLLCVKDGLTVVPSDLLVLLCSGVFSAHILLADYYAPRVDCVRLSCVQFLVCAALSAVAMLCVEHPSPVQLLAAWKPILYGGVCSCGIAYTLQIVGQRYTAPTVGSLLMSFESVFAVLSGAVILGQVPTGREWLGCGLMFAAILAAQIPGKPGNTE